MARFLPAAEAILVLAVTLPLAVALQIPTLWFLIPFVVVTVARRPYEEYGLTLRNPGSPRFHVTVCATIFGGYLAAHYAFGHWILGRPFSPALPPDFARKVFVQLVVIGLSEEFFFRGYLQTRLNRSFGRPYRLFGAPWGAGLVAAALLFGACHLVDGNFARLNVIPFGLFAGWLRERTGTIAVPAAYHGVANLLYDFMQRGFQG